MPNLRFGNNQDLLQQRGLGSDAAVCLGWQQSMCMWYYPQLQVFQQECYSSTREVHRGQKARRKKSHFSMLRAHLPASQQAMKHDCNCNLLRERSFWQQCSGSMEEIHSGFRMISWKENTRLTYSVGYYTGKNRQTLRFTLRMERGADSVQLTRQK